MNQMEPRVMKTTKQILIIDDDDSYRGMLRLRLELSGYAVADSADGLVGLRLVRRLRPDLVVLDLTLPDPCREADDDESGLDRRSGHKICRMIKFDQSLKHIPVLILTCSDSADDFGLAVKAGADAYLMKTGNPEILIGQIKRLIGRMDAVIATDPAL
jgi:DNA-binding response OmpR family regulator